NKSYFISTWQEFEKELNKRVLDLQYRNSMVVAKEEGVIVGWGTYTLINDYLGNKRALIHQVLTKKEDSYRKGIEELIIRELKLYIKRTLNLDKVFLICQDSDSALRNLVMKLSAKKSKNYWYENDI
ncbi:MAG: GNAT family N-acetyltransferase, partial [Candidatus Lokiarchaeota archaeon]|nr:GNAT family N-acetyltransferase [Candidatus Lokiarchaeota archaeon]